MSPSTQSPNSESSSSRNSETQPPGQAFAEAIRQLSELRAYVGYYVASRVDQIKLTIRSIVIWTVLGIIGLIAAAAMVVTAVAQILGGIAGGLSQIVPSYPWIGSLVTGLVVLAVIFVGVWLGVRMVGRMSRAALVAKYEAFKREQRQQFGRSVDDGAN